MKHEETSLNTKRRLAASLKGFMEKKPLSKITVSEIIADCGINRKTFYYHFPDIYALLKWMLEEEAIEVVRQADLLTNYQEVILFVMNYVRSNRHLLCCAYDTMGRDELKRVFSTDLSGIIQKLIDSLEQQLGVQVEDEFKYFLAHFYTGAIANLMIDEITDKQGHAPEKAVEYFSLILKSSLPEVLKTAPKKG